MWGRFKKKTSNVQGGKELGNFFCFRLSLIADVRGETVWLVSIHLLFDGCSSQGALTWEVRAFGGLTGRKRSAAVRLSDHQETRGCVWLLNGRLDHFCTCRMNDWQRGCLVCFTHSNAWLYFCEPLCCILKWGFCQRKMINCFSVPTFLWGKELTDWPCR